MPSSKSTSVKDSIKNFAEKIEKNFVKKFPTTALASRLKQNTSSQTSEQNKLINFFDANPDFDLQNHRIENYLADNAKDISDEDKPAVAGQLRRLQRVFKLAPTYEASQALLDKGIHSSAQVYAMGKDRFMKTFAPQLVKKKQHKFFPTLQKCMRKQLQLQVTCMAWQLHLN